MYFKKSIYYNYINVNYYLIFKNYLRLYLNYNVKEKNQLF